MNLNGIWAKLKSMFDQSNRPIADRAPDVPSAIGAVPELEIGTIKYLGDLASESFKRQMELDESVWRSLPFFAAIFAFVATVIGRSAIDAPKWELAFYPISTAVLLLFAVLSLGWSLRWFWIVLMPREYEYPSPDALVQQYARDTLAFHAASGVDAADLDARTERDLRLFMMEQYGNAAAANLTHNATKLKARPKVLLFLLVSFVLAFACEATIFFNRQFGVTPIAEGNRTDDDSNPTNAPAGQITADQSDAAPTGTAPAAASQGGRKLLGSQFPAGYQEQAVTRNTTNTSTPKPGSPTPMRPTPPSPTVVMKDRAVNLGNDKATPKPSAKPDRR